MAGRIPQTFIDELIARADIVEIVGSRVPLKKAGREYKACCPFHDEKTPSFWVSPDKQFYHCFGCGAHGTALGFLMQYEQLPFPEAVEDLAGRLGLEVPHEGGSAPAARGQEELTELLSRVAGFYQECLQTDERSRAYLRGRGLESATLERFRIGYAPDSWNEVLHRFGGTEAARKALQATGLIIERETPRAGSERFYDRFRDRIMFPIRDPRGRVLGFGGRVLEGGEPKYLNSPETELFHKGHELYGLHEIRLARTSLQRLLLVEGYMDVVRLHQAGLAYAVATLGTATTPEQLRRAFRLVSEVVFAFDGDRAGRAAAWRALQNALPEARAGRELRFLFLPEGEDPDSLVGREGRAAFESRLGSALPLSEYLVTQLREQADVSHADGRARFVSLARPLLAKVPPGVYLELLLARIAQEVGLTSDRLRELLGDTTDPGHVGHAHAERGSADAQRSGAADTQHLCPPPRPARARREATGGGRRGLLTQAIKLLLHFPASAAAMPAPLCTALAAIGEQEVAGIGTLRDLLEAMRAHGARSTAQLLEHWRERPEAKRLGALYAEPTLLDATQVRAELEGMLAGLVEQVRAERAARRYDELLARVNAHSASSEELKEFQLLLKGHVIH
jgi:DNA primase